MREEEAMTLVTLAMTEILLTFRLLWEARKVVEVAQ